MINKDKRWNKTYINNIYKYQEESDCTNLYLIDRIIDEATGNSLIRNSNIEDEYLKILYLKPIKKVLFKKI